MRNIIRADCPPEHLRTRQENNKTKRAEDNGSCKEKNFSIIQLRLDPEIREFLQLEPGDRYQLSELLILVDFAYLGNKAQKLKQWRMRKAAGGV
jgi:hypothetical protein